MNTHTTTTTTTTTNNKSMHSSPVETNQDYEFRCLSPYTNGWPRKCLVLHLWNSSSVCCYVCVGSPCFYLTGFERHWACRHACLLHQKHVLRDGPGYVSFLGVSVGFLLRHINRTHFHPFKSMVPPNPLGFAHIQIRVKQVKWVLFFSYRSDLIGHKMWLTWLFFVAAL
jgi:hypothetical protein